jgi:hypothetical protein
MELRMIAVSCVKNYCKNVDAIINMAEKYSDKFFDRRTGEEYNFSTAYGDSQIKSMFRWNMPEELKELIYESLPAEDKSCDGFVVNRYDPGDYLLRHKDSAGGYWKFKLIFLRSDRPHFAWYDENNQQHLVEEEPGMLFTMPINLEHEVTEIQQDEQPKYSLVLTWGKIR